MVRQPDLHACFHINGIDLLGYWLGIKAIDMKLGILAAPAITVAAIALLVVAAAGLLPAMGVLASSSADGQGETPTPVAAVESIAEPSATSTPVPFNLPAAPDKSEPPALPANRSAKGRTSEVEGSGEGTVYTWEDGDRTLRVLLQTDLVVQETASNTPEDVVVARGAGDSIVQKEAKHGQDSRPVFRSESGGGLMMLPGGVLLALDPKWDRARVESFFSRNNISSDRTSELGFLENGFLVRTEPGFPSLELANALAAQDGVVIASPNWWREVEEN